MQRKFLEQVPVSYPLLTVKGEVPKFYQDIARYPAIFLIDRQSRGLLAACQRPAIEDRKLLCVDLQKLRFVLNIHEHMTFSIADSKLGLTANWNHAGNLTIGCVDGNGIGTAAIEGENAF